MPMGEEIPRLFDLPPAIKVVRPTIEAERIWTENKARFIAGYLYGFVLVTKHGNYIDGFAGVQDARDLDAWAAALALQNEPEWLRRFFLFDNDARKIALLEELADKHRHRDVRVIQGDFNERVRGILNHETLPRNEAAFCLLDQRTFELNWETVVALADYKRGTRAKIELFYFLADWWFARTYKSRKTDDSLQDIAAWWGREDWRRWCDARGIDRAHELCRRFRQELGYGYATPYAIYSKRRGAGRVAYYMVHATDHPDAPRLMRDAYQASVAVPKPLPGMRLDSV